MKISLALGPRQPLSRQTAWGCLTSNLALPGIGSLVAGRPSGYPQAALAFLGMFLTIGFGGRFIVWFFANWSRLHQPENDLAVLADMWRAVRWSLFGMATFLLGWLWALATSLQILHSAKQAEKSSSPPII